MKHNKLIQIVLATLILVTTSSTALAHPHHCCCCHCCKNGHRIPIFPSYRHYVPRETGKKVEQEPYDPYLNHLKTAPGKPANIKTKVKVVYPQHSGYQSQEELVKEDTVLFEIMDSLVQARW